MDFDKVQKMPSNTKINLICYTKYIKCIFEDEISTSCGKNCNKIELDMDKAINYTSKIHILKSSNASVIDFCKFDFLQRALGQQ